MNNNKKWGSLEHAEALIVNEQFGEDLDWSREVMPSAPDTSIVDVSLGKLSPLSDNDREPL